MVLRAVLTIFFFALALSLSGTTVASDTGKREPREYFFTPTFGDLPEEMAAAREQGKIGMLLFFEADACAYCQRMLGTVLSSKEIQDWYNERFVSIAVDIHGDVKLTDFDGISLPSKVFSAHRRAFLTPMISFLNLDGVEIYRHLGMIRSNEDMLLLGEYIEGEHYFDKEYSAFYRQHREQAPDEILTTPHTLSGDE